MDLFALAGAFDLITADLVVVELAALDFVAVDLVAGDLVAVECYYLFAWTCLIE